MFAQRQQLWVLPGGTMSGTGWSSLCRSPRWKGSQRIPKMKTRYSFDDPSAASDSENKLLIGQAPSLRKLKAYNNWKTTRNSGVGAIGKPYRDGGTISAGRNLGA